MASLTAADMPLSRSAVARYIQLATLFRSRIMSGQWPPGTQIPTIEQLMTECGVARATIRQALGLLEDEGLVSRYRAKGTFVTEKARAHVWLDVTTDLRGMLNTRDGATIEVLEDTLVPALERWPHDIGTIARTYRRLRRRHARDGRPFLVAEVYIDAGLASRLPKRAMTTLTAMRLAASIPGVQIENARQTMTIGSSDLEISELLGLPLNAPICFVDRSAVDQRGRLVLVSKGIYRGDVVRLDMDVK
jgi:GntR family transcriptional regulator